LPFSLIERIRSAGFLDFYEQKKSLHVADAVNQNCQNHI